MWQLAQFSGRAIAGWLQNCSSRLDLGFTGLFCFPPNSAFCLSRRWLFKMTLRPLSLLWDEKSRKDNIIQ